MMMLSTKLVSQGIKEGGTIKKLSPEVKTITLLCFLGICMLVLNRSEVTSKQEESTISKAVNFDPSPGRWDEAWSNMTSIDPIPWATLKENIKALGPDLMDLEAKRLFEIFPAPKRQDTIEIYNPTAYQELVDTIASSGINRTLTICANGGSATSGAGVPEVHRYLTQFGKHIRHLGLMRKNTIDSIDLVDRGHGGRNSLHSAIFSSHFFVPNTDLILWEFAINDVGYYLSEEAPYRQVRSMLIAWLDEVKKLDQPKPPKVILVYLWSRPFSWDEENKIQNPVYEWHAKLAKEFDFVVGHVNVASYFEEINWEKQDLDDLKRLFLKDLHHPNHQGHLTIAFLLLNLIRGTGEWRDTDDQTMTNDKGSSMNGISSHVEKYGWYCGNTTQSKRFIQSRVVDSSTESISGWRSPLGTLTLEKPHNDLERGSKRQLILNSTAATIILGKQDPMRSDRQVSTPLACCSNKNDVTAIRVQDNVQPMENVRAIFFCLGQGLPDMTKMEVRIGGNKVDDVDGELIKVGQSWPCFWGWKYVYATHWFAFSEVQQSVSSLDICVENIECSVNGTSDTMMMSMAVYAE